MQQKVTKDLENEFTNTCVFLKLIFNKFKIPVVRITLKINFKMVSHSYY